MSGTIKSETPSNGNSSIPGSMSSSSKPSRTSTPDGWQEIGLYCYNEQDLKDKKYHMARFNNKNDVDIVRDFTKPVRLHRKDPTNLQFHLSRKEIAAKKREEQQKAAEKAIRRQQRLAGIPVPDEDDEEEENTEGKIKTEGGSDDDKMDLSQVAPEGGARNFRKNMFKRKTRRVNLMNDDQRKLRYEEFYPWVMEDYDGQNVYVGNYEAGATETTQVLFVFDSNGFKMVPIEKVYKFNPRNKYATLTLEEAEAKMEKKSAVPRWLMKHMEDDSNKDYRFKNNGEGSSGVGSVRNPAIPNSRNNRMRTVTGGSSTNNDRDSDHDDIDFEEEFADDEEAPIMDGDEEENKLSEQKIKREMLKAAHFDAEDDAKDDDNLDDLFETEKSRKIDREGKKLRKVLNKTEGGVYDSDDDDDNANPYLSRSDLESDDDEEVEIKQEPGLESLTPLKPRQIFAKNYGDGFIVIKAPGQFLKDFPKGEWVPNGRKRPIQPLDSPNKKQKLDREKSISPTPITGDLNDAGDGSLVTVKEVLDILRGNPLTTKELLGKLRTRVSANKENKSRIIDIVRKNLKLSDGKLVLKE